MGKEAGRSMGGATRVATISRAPSASKGAEFSSRPTPYRITGKSLMGLPKFNPLASFDNGGRQAGPDFSLRNTRPFTIAPQLINSGPERNVLRNKAVLTDVNRDVAKPLSTHSHERKQRRAYHGRDTVAQGDRYHRNFSPKVEIKKLSEVQKPVIEQLRHNPIIYDNPKPSEALYILSRKVMKKSFRLANPKKDANVQQTKRKNWDLSYLENTVSVLRKEVLEEETAEVSVGKKQRDRDPINYPFPLAEPIVPDKVLSKLSRALMVPRRVTQLKQEQLAPNTSLKTVNVVEAKAVRPELKPVFAQQTRPETRQIDHVQAEKTTEQKQQEFVVFTKITVVKDKKPDEEKGQKYDVDTNANQARWKMISVAIKRFFADRSRKNDELYAKEVTNALPQAPTDELLSELAKNVGIKYDGSYTAILNTISKAGKIKARFQKYVKAVIESFPAVRVRKRPQRPARKEDAWLVVNGKVGSEGTLELKSLPA